MMHTNIYVLKSDNLNLTTNPFRWIPKGLMYDLMDNRNDNNAVPRRIPLDDNVTGYTIQQIFNALQSDVTSLQ